MNKTTNISVFLDRNGKIERIPVPNRTKIPLLRYLAEKFETDRDYTEKEINKLTHIKQQNIYLIVQEVLNNIVKHSQAKEATIQAFFNDGVIRVSIEDDGIGWDENRQTDGIGIQNMYKRAALAELRLTIDASSGGTFVSIETQLD